MTSRSVWGGKINNHVIQRPPLFACVCFSSSSCSQTKQHQPAAVWAERTGSVKLLTEANQQRAEDASEITLCYCVWVINCANSHANVYFLHARTLNKRLQTCKLCCDLKMWFTSSITQFREFTVSETISVTFSLHCCISNTNKCI